MMRTSHTLTHLCAQNKTKQRKKAWRSSIGRRKSMKLGTTSHPEATAPRKKHPSLPDEKTTTTRAAIFYKKKKKIKIDDAITCWDGNTI